MATTEHPPVDDPNIALNSDVFASEALDLAHNKIIAYEHALNERGSSEIKYPSPGEVILSKDTDPHVFSEQVADAARLFLTKTKVIDVRTATSTDEALGATQKSLRHFGNSYKNALVLMLEGVEAEEIQMKRRDQLRATVAELVVPSLVIYSDEL